MRILVPPLQAASSGTDGDTAAAAAAQQQLERAFEERTLAQDSVRDMAERYSVLQEKFRHEMKSCVKLIRVACYCCTQFCTLVMYIFGYD